MAIVDHFKENNSDKYSYISPSSAFMQAELYLGLLKSSYNKITGEVNPWGREVRNKTKRLQAPFGLSIVPDFFRRRLPGLYEYNFTSPGVTFLRLVVKNKQDSKKYGSDFLFRFSPDFASNHAGLCTWMPSGEIFVFDPNCGGLLFWWGTCEKVASLPAAIDMALERLYMRFDRLKGSRVAKIVSAQKLDINDLNLKNY